MSLLDLAHRIQSKVNTVITDEQAVDVISETAQRTLYASSGVTIVSGLTLNEWGVVVGMILGVATFAFKVWFDLKYKRGNTDEK